eukprot:s1351_g1.t1
MAAVGEMESAPRPWFVALNQRVKMRQSETQSPSGGRFPRSTRAVETASSGEDRLALTDKDKEPTSSSGSYCVMRERGNENLEAFVGAHVAASRLVLGPDPQVAAEAIRSALGLPFRA